MAKRGSHGIVEEKKHSRKKEKNIPEKSYSQKRRESSLSYRERRELQERRKTETEHSYSDSQPVRSTPARRSREKEKTKSKGKGVVILVAVLAVIIAVAVGVFLYFNGVPNRNADKTEETTQTTTALHETLVVVTVTDNVITYNGEEIASSIELENRLSEEEKPTLSLVNMGADIDTYNSVAEVLNKFGGTYEMMDKKNTNPSIHTTEETTAQPTTESTDISSNKTEE